MRWIGGCLAVCFLACFMCACIGGVAVAAKPSSGPLSFASIAEASPVETSEALKESYDHKWDDFSNQLAAAPPGSPPVSGSFSNGEVSSKLTSLISEAMTEDTGVTVKSALVNFKDNLALVTIKLDIQGKAIEVRSSLSLTPAGKKIRIKPQQVVLFGVAPFPIPITEFVNSALANESTPLEIDFPREVQSIEMKDGRLVITAKP